MSHRSPAVAVGAAAALLITAGSASAAPAPTAKLTTAKQSELIGARKAHAIIAAPAKSVATVSLLGSDGRRLSAVRELTFRHAKTARIDLKLNRKGLERVDDCVARKLELRVTLRRGKHVTTLRDRRVVDLDGKLCSAPTTATAKSRPATPPATHGGPPAFTPPAGGDTPAAPPAEEHRKDQSLFQVGTSVVDISPTKPMVVGGYGSNYLVTNGVRDPLQVRAFFVGRGDQAVTFVSVDAQGWFAGYQSPNIGDGADDARREAAAVLAERGYKVNSANVVVSATHDHAAPTIMGIWGHTDPEYLHQIKEATVQAVREAESSAREAELWTATGNIKGLLSEVQGTDQMAGFNVDDSLPILWAREPGTGATLGMYADVPVHVDQYNPINASDHKFSADYPGYVRDRLAKTLGGTSVIAAGTLGRQEAIGASSEYAEVEKQGDFITNAMMRALRNAHRITDTTLGAARQDFATPAENAGLMMAMSCNHPGGPLGCQGGSEPVANNGAGTWLWTAGQMFTVNRSMDAPWFLSSPNRIGTSSTVARIGDQVFATAPGEAFPEVTSAIQRTFAGASGIDGVHVIDHAGDQLGYYWDQRAGVYPSDQLAQSDFAKFNVGSKLAQDNVNAARAAGEALGLAATPQDAFAEINDANAFAKPHVQFYAKRESDARTVSFYSSAKKAQRKNVASTAFGSAAGTMDSQIAWDFGDGTTATLAPSTRFDHTFPGPGTYEVKASIVDNLGATYSWTQTVVVDAPLSASIDRLSRGDHVVLTAGAEGGDGSHVMAAHWSFSDGTTAEGTTVTHAWSGQATLAIVDGAGNTATTTVDLG